MRQADKETGLMAVTDLKRDGRVLGQSFGIRKYYYEPRHPSLGRLSDEDEPYGLTQRSYVRGGKNYV
ncbi:MAG TPA: hypothetical protein EYP21_01780 [Syntrophaceae bacterium]|nr:hypothetical protein [Syntrophaceae bacterium]